MTKKRLISVFCLMISCFLASTLCAHVQKIELIIDTDMALDDIRALSMLLNSDEFKIHLIVSSDGSTSPGKGLEYINRMLKYYDKEDVVSAQGRELDIDPPPWRSLTENVQFPEKASGIVQIDKKKNATDSIINILDTNDVGFTYICLGPMTNLCDAIRKNPFIKVKISSVIFYGTPPDSQNPDWNYKRDPESANYVFNSGVNLYTFNIDKDRLLTFDETLFNAIKSMKTPASELIATTHNTEKITELLLNGHFKIWDEMIAVYLFYPSNFEFEPDKKNDKIMILKDFRKEDILENYKKLLGHDADFHLSSRKTVVLNEIPKDPMLFKRDVKPYVDKIIEKYGYEEWKACLLTNEFHRHLGIYSILGAKMGVRAREILEAPFDSLEVISLAGNEPPLSCMIDGLQVSTGASLGRGSIKVSGENGNEPAAIFIYNDRKITLKIKGEIIDRIRSDIKLNSSKYGWLTPAYFQNLRKLSLEYWLNMDRKDIFDEIEN